MSVSRLAYVGANATDVGMWKKYATDVLGFEISHDSNDRVLYLRADDRHHRMSIHGANNDDIAVVGWELASRESLEAVTRTLDANDVKVVRGTPEEKADRRVVDLVHFTCPFTGVRMELVVGPEEIFAPRYRLTGAVSGFKTAELGMGHFVLYTKDADAAARFYVRTLGFGLSDWVVNPDGQIGATFLHCNPRHHSMAFINWPGAARTVQHVFFETNTLDDLGASYDLCASQNVAATTIGRHPNDKSVSFYFRNPSRWFFEYGWDLRVIDRANWTPEQYVLRPGMSWGHAGLREMEGNRENVR